MNEKFPLDYGQCPRDFASPLFVKPILMGCEFHFARTTILDENAEIEGLLVVKVPVFICLLLDKFKIYLVMFSV